MTAPGRFPPRPVPQPPADAAGRRIHSAAGAGGTWLRPGHRDRIARVLDVDEEV